MRKKLSIITINYNNLAGLKKTFESVFHQTFQDFEYIVIDGGSTDGSKELIEQYQDQIDYWVSEKDGGIYNAMNKGIIKASGEYLQFLNSGDTLVDLAILTKVFDIPRNEAIIYGDLHEVLPNGTTKIMIPLQENELTLANFNSNVRATIMHPSSFIRRALFEDGLYDESYKIIADIKFFIERIIMQNCTVKYVPYVISNFNLEGLSSDPKNWAKTIEERNRIFREFLPSRIHKDYEIYFQVKDSPLLVYLPFLEKTDGLKKLVTKVVSILIAVYKLIKPSAHK
jgi:glycosyltransferase involved in cell wall biosynthesis